MTWNIIWVALSSATTKHFPVLNNHEFPSSRQKSVPTFASLSFESWFPATPMEIELIFAFFQSSRSILVSSDFLKRSQMVHKIIGTSSLSCVLCSLSDPTDYSDLISSSSIFTSDGLTHITFNPIGPSDEFEFAECVLYSSMKIDWYRISMIIVCSVLSSEAVSSGEKSGCMCGATRQARRRFLAKIMEFEWRRLTRRKSPGGIFSHLFGNSHIAQLCPLIREIQTHVRSKNSL